MLAQCSVLGSLIQGITYLSCTDLVIFCFCFCFWEWLLKALWGSSNGFETLELHNKYPLVEPWGGDAPYLICISCLTNLAQLHRVSSLLRLRETSTCRVRMHWGFFMANALGEKSIRYWPCEWRQMQLLETPIITCSSLLNIMKVLCT